MKYVIIGNGVAGINAALTIREKVPLSEIYIISWETKYFFSRTALMYIGMGRMRLEDTEPYARDFFYQKKISLVNDLVIGINKEDKKISLSNNGELPYDKLLLATGAVPAFYGWSGTDYDGVVTFVTYPDLQNLLRLITYTKKHRNKAVVVGGGLIGIELVEVLLHHRVAVDFIIREKTFWDLALSPDEGIFLMEHMKRHNINLYMETELKEVVGANSKVTGIITNKGEEIACDIVGITTGVKPNIDLAKDAGIPTGRGILANWNMETKIDDIYTAGDCVEIETPGTERNFSRMIWYGARDMGKIAGINMTGGDACYVPSDWYNSAKFFDMEYTVCGKNLAVDDDDETYFYIDKKGRFTVSIIHQKNMILGFSMIGGRWDHTVLLNFIINKRDLNYFFKNYKQAWFAPEFTPAPVLMHQ